MIKKELALSKEALCRHLGELCAEIDVCVHDRIDSTNTEAKRMIARGHDRLSLIAAEEQSGGRGRMGRSFYSPGGTGAYFSILYRPTVPVDTAVTVTCAASVAVLRAIRTLTGKTCGIKWVNDLYLDQKKVCGILTECQSLGDSTYVIVGIGINISTSFEKTELSPIAGSLGFPRLSPSELIAAVTRELLPMLKSPDSAWLEEYRCCSCVLGKRISYLQNGEMREALALAIDGNGALIVRCDDGREERLFSGEISLKMQ